MTRDSPGFGLARVCHHSSRAAREQPEGRCWPRPGAGPGRTSARRAPSRLPPRSLAQCQWDAAGGPAARASPGQATAACGSWQVTSSNEFGVRAADRTEVTTIDSSFGHHLPGLVLGHSAARPGHSGQINEHINSAWFRFHDRKVWDHGIEDSWFSAMK